MSATGLATGLIIGGLAAGPHYYGGPMPIIAVTTHPDMLVPDRSWSRVGSLLLVALSLVRSDQWYLSGSQRPALLPLDRRSRGSLPV
jgi:hypothetical protein